MSSAGEQDAQRAPADDLADVLVVDDDELIRTIVGRILTGEGYRCSYAADAHEARVKLASQRFALAFVDVMMPGESGVELVTSMLNEHADLAAVMLTGVDDPEVADLALAGGAYGYLVKPFRPNELRISAANAARRRRLEVENRAHLEQLEQQVEQRTADLREAMGRLEEADRQVRQSVEETVHALARTIEHRDEETSAHVQRMSWYAALIARGMGWDEEQCELLRLAAPMHDVGKVSVPDGILFKPGKLSVAEFEVIKAHAERGAEILGKSDSALLVLAALVARTHHERWDGTGYPYGLAGEEIPQAGRIAAVSDVFDAMVSRRVYKPALPIAQAVDALRDGRGTQFDGEVVDVFLESMEAAMEISQRYPDPWSTAGSSGSSIVGAGA
ncbi:MAG TPA: HD domain-containing phosphohydrolase [Acidimicrobiales bacterium]|nr:HD domain-containing phosphohydrolase [Acidimicrobiales bacterium]